MMIHDHIQRGEYERQADAALCWKMLNASHLADPNDAVRQFRNAFPAYSHLTKAAVVPAGVSAVSPDQSPLTGALLALVDAQDVRGRFAGAGAVSIGLNAGARIQVGDVTAHPVAEGDNKPVGRISFDVSGLPSKVSGEVIISREALRSLDPATQAGIRQAVVSATARATDEHDIDALIAAGTSVPSADAGDLLAAISGGRPAAPALIGDYVGLLSLGSLLTELRALGVLILATPAADGRLIAVDVSGLLLSDGGAELRIARDANVLMDDGASPAGTTVVSLWQSNLESIRCERWLRLEARADAVAYTTLGS